MEPVAEPVGRLDPRFADERDDIVPLDDLSFPNHGDDEEF